MKIPAKTDKHFLSLLKLLLAAGLAMPLLMSASFIFPYTAPKVLAFRILVEIAAALYLYLALKYPDLRPRPTALSLAVGGFLAVSFLAAIFGANFFSSWWGNLERGMGIWGLAHFAAWFLMLPAVFKEKKDWRKLIIFSLGVSVAVAATAASQRLGGAGGLLPATDRIYGTLGNAGILAGYLLFNLFLAVYLFFESAARRKWLLAAVAAFLAGGLFLTGTRGALAGLAAGLVVFFVCLFLVDYFKAGSGRPKKTFWIFLVAILILTAALFLSRNSSFVKNNFILSRLTSVSLSEPTIQSRLILWQDAWRAWLAAPWLGAGPENFEAAVNKYLSPRLTEFEAYAADRAHNFIFDYGLTVGWLGLLSYLALPAAAALALWRRRQEAAISAAVLISALVAYLVQNLFIFDSPAAYLMLFFVLALINAASPPEAGTEPRGVNLGYLKKVIILAAAVGSLFSVYSFSLKPLLAAACANRILSLPALEAAAAAPALADTLALNTFASPEIVYQVALDYIDKISQNPALAGNEEFYGAAAGGLAKTIERSPEQARNYIALAWLDLYFSGQQPARVSEALSLGERARQLSPARQDAYLVLVAGYILGGQTDKAWTIVSQALAVDGRMGETVRQYWESLQ